MYPEKMGTKFEFEEIFSFENEVNLSVVIITLAIQLRTAFIYLFIHIICHLRLQIHIMFYTQHIFVHIEITFH